MSKTISQYAEHERILAVIIRDKIEQVNKYSLYSHITPFDGDDPYDMFLQFYSHEPRKFLKTFFVEIKIRSDHYDNLMLENLKYNRIKHVIKKDNHKAEIIYIVTTPQATYFFNLCRMNNFEWKNDRKFVKSTANDHTLIKKKVCYLDIKDAFKVIPITTADVERLKKEKDEKLKLSNKPHTKKTNCIFGGKLN